MRLMTRRRALVVAFVLVVLAAGGLIALPYVHGLSFVIRAAEMQGTMRRVAGAHTGADP